MRWIAGLMLAAFAGPSVAQDTAGSASCEEAWRAISEAFMATGAIEVVGTTTGASQEFCEITDVVVDMEGQYAPDWHLDRLRITQEVVPFLAGLVGRGAVENLSPGTYRIDVEGLRIVVQTGQAQLDWVYAAQSRRNKIDAELVMAWDASGKTFRVEAFNIDFPGDNLVEFSALANGVDLSSTGAVQMSATSFALTEADLRIQTQGLFEWHLLVPLGTYVLPYEGDMDAAVAGLQAEATAAVAELPDATVPKASKEALAALIAELPNPSGTVTLSFRADPGFGPARFLGYAANGVPDSLQEAEPLMDGVTVGIGWTHEDAR
jgi:hypothetical protein